MLAKRPTLTKFLSCVTKLIGDERLTLTAKLDVWIPLPANIRDLQAMTRRIEHLLEMQQMERNRLDTADTAIIDSINSVLNTLEAELKATRKAIHNHIDNDPDLKDRSKLLDSIPGIGSLQPSLIY